MKEKNCVPSARQKTSPNYGDIFFTSDMSRSLWRITVCHGSAIGWQIWPEHYQGRINLY